MIKFIKDDYQAILLSRDEHFEAGVAQRQEQLHYLLVILFDAQSLYVLHQSENLRMHSVRSIFESALAEAILAVACRSMLPADVLK